MDKAEAESIDAIFAAWKREDFPGCAVAVIENGAVVYRRGFGMADLSHGAPITPETPFHVASVSKQFTAAAVLLLCDLGKLSLEDDIRLYFPEWQLPDPTITIRHLITNTSGLRDQWDLLALAGYRYAQDLITDRDVLALVERQKELNFAPGAQYRYSNTGFTLAAQIVERASGESFREFTSRRIFTPLGMHNSHFRDDHTEINKGEALGYVSGEDGAFRLAVTNFDTVGATSLYTTVDDLAKWDANFHEPIVGGTEFCQRMTQCATLSSGASSFYAMGLMVLSYRGLRIIEHGGADAGYRANILRFPDQRFSVISLFNTPTLPSALNRRVADVCLNDHFASPPSALKSNYGNSEATLTAEGRVGFYRSRATGAGLLFKAVDGKLALATRGKPILVQGLEGSGFYLPESIDPARFDPLRGEALHLIVHGEGKPPEIWDRLPAFQLSTNDVVIAGSYYSEELDVYFHVVRQNERLLLRRKKFPDAELIPVAVDTFTTEVGVLHFLKNEAQMVTEMVLTTGRVQNLRLSRVSAND